MTKENIKIFLKKKKYSFIDLGPNSDNRVDYPDYAHSVAKKVKICVLIHIVFFCNKINSLRNALNQNFLVHPSQQFFFNTHG